jgi:poly(3-hydroxybutyrate) depolymerase
MLSRGTQMRSKLFMAIPACLLSGGISLAATDACSQGPVPVRSMVAPAAALPANPYKGCHKVSAIGCGPVPGPPVSMVYRTHQADTVREGNRSMQRAIVPSHPTKEIHAPFQRMVPPGQKRG